MIRYARAPSPDLRTLLAPGGFLAPLLAERTVAGLPLDVHLREGDRVQAYCGLTRVIDARFGRGRVRFSAHLTYTSQACATGLFRRWAAGEWGLEEALTTYFGAVVIRPALLQREGAVQAAWSRVRTPWVPFDREAVIGYADLDTQALHRSFPAIEAARAELDAEARSGGWAPMSEGKVGAELDQIAIDPEGRLVLLELKDAEASPASVYYAPLQLLQYAHEWAAALPAVRGQVQELLDARIALGLSPAGLPRLNGRIRVAVGFGEDRRSAEVRARFETVRRIVSRHLPPGVAGVEAWTLDGGVAMEITRGWP
jgi:hypothetical protein